MPSTNSSSTYQFADDITHSESAATADELTQKLTDSFLMTKDFCEDRNLVINADKTQFIIFKAPSKKINDNLEISICDAKLTPLKSVKLLGITLDSHLTFGEHIDNTVKKCHALLAVLRRAAPLPPKELSKLAYIALIRSHLEYGSSLFARAANTHLKKLETVQKMAARIICQVSRQAHSAPLLDELKLQNLNERRDDHVLDLMQYFLNNNKHPAFDKFLAINADNTICRGNPLRTVAGKKRIAHYGAELYNSYITKV